MLTVQLAYELHDTAIKVNSADPGHTATDLNGHRGHQTVQQGAAEIVRWSLLTEEDRPEASSIWPALVPGFQWLAQACAR